MNINFNINYNLSFSNTKNKSKIIYNFNDMEIGKKWAIYFYNNWILDPDIFLKYNIIKSKSKLTYKNNIYEGVNIINILKTIKSYVNNYLQINWSNIEVLTNSNKFFILITGNINNHRFSQSFVLKYNIKEDWTLLQSNLIIE